MHWPVCAATRRGERWGSSRLMEAAIGYLDVDVHPVRAWWQNRSGRRRGNTGSPASATPADGRVILSDGSTRWS